MDSQRLCFRFAVCAQAFNVINEGVQKHGIHPLVGIAPMVKLSPY